MSSTMNCLNPLGMRDNRKHLLARLVAYELPIEPVLEALSSLPADSNEEPVSVRRADVVSIIDRFLDGELTPDQVTDWADQIELREDVGVEEGHREAVRDAVFRLANPNLRGPITLQMARALRRRLLAGD
jgi:hypothetical protein